MDTPYTATTTTAPLVLQKKLFNIRFLQLNIFRNGIWVPWIISPVAPPGEQKIRVIVSAQHTEDDIKRALDHFKDAKKLLKREKI